MVLLVSQGVDIPDECHQIHRVPAGGACCNSNMDEGNSRIASIPASWRVLAGLKRLIRTPPLIMNRHTAIAIAHAVLVGSGYTEQQYALLCHIKRVNISRESEKKKRNKLPTAS